MTSNIAIIVFARHHYLQIKHFKKQCNDGTKLYVVGSRKYNSDFCLPDDFDGGSFWQCTSGNLIHSIVDFLIAKNVQKLMITDLNYPLQNIVYSELLRRSLSPIKVTFYYDGLINIIDDEIIFKEKIKDVIRSCLARISGYNFTRRQKLLNGKDLLRNEHLEKIDALYEFSKSLENIKEENNAKICKINYLYIVQGHKNIEKEYNHFLKESLRLLEKEFKGKSIYLLDRPKYPSSRIDGYDYIQRLHDEETAEEVIMRLNLDGVVSTPSSALVNIKLLRPDLSVLCFDLSAFCKVFKDTDYSKCEVAMESVGVAVVNRLDI